jgi:flavin reductase (DIM6/NTAB) family NADH-FMN oxidoreductase RutF
MIYILMTGEIVSSPSANAASGDSQSLRECLGKLATGITIFNSADASGGCCGMTANSFSSVSLEPPLILWNIAKVSNSLQAYLDAEHFAINILADDQRALSAHFATTDHTQFEDVEFVTSANGVPILPNTLACLECRTHQIHDSGDHYIVVGEVESFRSDDRLPLLFYGGQYGELNSSTR